MVIPFLSLYLTKSKGFSLGDVGWVMTFFGLGSVVGSWCGGKLCDRFGNYAVMTWSFFLTGLAFIGLQFIEGFWAMCIAVLIVTALADSFRPAMMIALKLYSKEENRTRSISLIRLAINLGFAGGPAVGGYIIYNMGYEWLFWVDGLTCLGALVLMLVVLHPKRKRKTEETEIINGDAKIFSDYRYWQFLIAMALFGIIFLQLFSSVPIYYKDGHFLTEEQIGLLLGANGLLIFLIEMPLIKYLEDRKSDIFNMMIIGTALVVLSYFLFNLSSWSGILWISMILISVGEVLVFPFSNAFALKRAERGKQGEYMTWYMVSFSVAHIFGHNSGMQMMDIIGFEWTWYILGGIGTLVMIILWTLRNSFAKEAVVAKK